MIRSRSPLLAACAVVAVLVAPLAAQVRLPSDGGSLRIVIRCNVDGSYTCANERCSQYCCDMPG